MRLNKRATFLYLYVCVRVYVKDPPRSVIWVIACGELPLADY